MSECNCQKPLMVPARGLEDTSEWLIEEVKSLWKSSRGMNMFMEAIDNWMSIGACNWNKEGELDYHRENEESQLPERLRNIIITPNDVERVGKPPEKLKSYDDEQKENLSCGGDWHGVSNKGIAYMECTRSTKAISTRDTEVMGVVVVSDACVKKEVECSS
jgi:hypothetical protein